MSYPDLIGLRKKVQKYRLESMEVIQYDIRNAKTESKEKLQSKNNE